MRAVKVLRTGRIGPYRRIFSSFVRHLEQRLSEYWNNNPTALVLGNRWIGNLARNLKHIENAGVAQSLPRLNEPIVLVGAGPSLHSSLSQIKKLAYPRYILCVDTALPILWEHGITPNGVVILEAQYWNSHDFLPIKKSDLKKQTWDVFLDLTSFPSIRGLFDYARIFYFASKFYQSVFFDSLNQSVPILPALGNVSVLALYLSLLLTKQSISIFGVDFGTNYSGEVVPGGHHHRWMLSSSDRFSSLSLEGHQRRKLQDRDFQLFSSLAESSGRKIAYSSEVRKGWNPQSQVRSQEFTEDFSRNSPYSSGVAFLERLLYQGKCLSSGSVTETDQEYRDFFKGIGSILLLPAPGSITLDQVSNLAPYLKRSLFELSRGLGKDNSTSPV